MTPAQYDTLELQIRKEQAEDKKGFSASFNTLVREWLDMAYMLPKDKKENFITREKLTSMIYKIIRSQKKFKDPANIFGQLRYLAVFDQETKEIGKLFSINILTHECEYFTYYDKMNGYDTKTKHWRDILLFDYNSIQMEFFHREMAAVHKTGLNFTDMCHFLENTDFIAADKQVPTKGYGVELKEAKDHPVMKQVMLEYKIPDEVVKKPKRKLYQMDATTYEVIAEFESIKEAAEKTTISSSTIHNVLCSGYSAIKYLLAGGAKWRYSTEPNMKYYWSKKLGKDYSALTKEKWNELLVTQVADEAEILGL